MVLSAAGRVEHDQIVDLADKYFGSVPRTPANAEVPVPLSYVGGDGRETRVLEQAHLVLGCEGIGYRDPDYFALAVYSTLFGGGMSSRLFQRIREERGLVYGIHCFNTAYADGGLFGIYAGTGEDDLAELVPAVCEEFVGVAGTLNEEELVRARNQIKAGTLMAPGIERRALRAGGAPSHRPRPADPLCRDRGPHRGGRPGRRAPRRHASAAGQADPGRAGADRRAGSARQDRRAVGCLDFLAGSDATPPRIASGGWTALSRGGTPMAARSMTALTSALLRIRL